MPTIDSSLVPTISPGQLFTRLTTDTSLNIRWVGLVEPVYYEVVNRPIADVALRQLILAKALDQINLRLSHQGLFPFLIQAQVTSGTSQVDVPLSWIWDMHVSVPAKWEKIRLAKIKRISGTNTTTPTGKLRLIFTGQEEGSSTETAIFMVDYQIDSVLDYQIVRITVPTSSEESVVINPSESQTIDGFIILRTLDSTDAVASDFYDLVAPPLVQTDADSDGLFDSPAVYQIVDSAAGGTNPTDDFQLTALSHGTGLLVASAINHIPDINSDIDTWLLSFNYPFDSEVSLQSTSHTGVTIPSGLFREFNILAPTSDEPTGDTSGNYFPVWLSRINHTSDSTDTLTFYFSTFNVETPSTEPIEFASLTLHRDDAAGVIVQLTPIETLWTSFSGEANWFQEFGKGHVVLSSKWGGTDTDVTQFFDDISALTDDPADVLFSKATARLSSYSIARTSKYSPTVGQGGALRGSLGDTTPPTATNRYVVESDEGLGTQVDFATHEDLDESKRTNVDIERYGYTGRRVHKIVSLVVDTSGTDHDYDIDILPRLVILLGRNPVFGDGWWDGTRFKWFNGDTWVG